MKEIRNLFLCFILIIVSYYDMTEMKIPNRLIAAGLCGRMLIMIMYREGLQGIRSAIFGGMVMPAILFLFILLYESIRRKKVFGGGDIKLLVMTGSFLGWEGNMEVLFISCVIAALCAAAGGKKRLPFAPCVLLSVLSVMIFNADFG